MSISAVTQTNATAVVNNVAVTPVTKETTESKPQPTPTTTDTVQISSAAKAILQEFTETTVQTAQEARNGDIQAQHLQAERGCC